MTCEEFAIAGLELGATEADSALQIAAREHLRECPHCAVLHENWLALRADLRALGTETAEAGTPPRVEMRLRQEFRTKHITVKRQRVGIVLGWSLAAAAVLVCTITWVNWRAQRDTSVAHQTGVSTPTATSQGNSDQPSGGVTPPAGSELGDVLVASNGSSDFTLLPGSITPAPENATVVRVRMQRAALDSLGLTVNEEHASDWIQVDLLVGEDGLPQAVRLAQPRTRTSN